MIDWKLNGYGDIDNFNTFETITDLDYINQLAYIIMMSYDNDYYESPIGLNPSFLLDSINVDEDLSNYLAKANAVLLNESTIKGNVILTGYIDSTDIINLQLKNIVSGKIFYSAPVKGYHYLKNPDKEDKQTAFTSNILPQLSGQFTLNLYSCVNPNTVFIGDIDLTRIEKYTIIAKRNFDVQEYTKRICNSGNIFINKITCIYNDEIIPNKITISNGSIKLTISDETKVTVEYIKLSPDELTTFSYTYIQEYTNALIDNTMSTTFHNINILKNKNILMTVKTYKY